MTIRQIIEDALEKYPPVVYPTRSLGQIEIVGQLKEKGFDASEAARYAAGLIFNEVEASVKAERAEYAKTKQELEDLKGALRQLLKGGEA